MLSRCGRRLLHVLGLSFPLLTGRPRFLFPHRFMKPQVVFVLGGPGAGKGTQRSVDADHLQPSWQLPALPACPRRRTETLLRNSNNVLLPRGRPWAARMVLEGHGGHLGS